VRSPNGADPAEAGSGDPEPARTGPAYVPLRTKGWPTRRAPRWAVFAFAGLLVIAVGIGLAHRPTPGERAADLRGFLQDMTTDIESCAGGVSESLQVLHAIQAGGSHDRGTAINVAETGAANCSPANNEQLDDLESYQVPESLDSYHLQNVVTALVTWAAPDAQRVQTDVARILTARDPAARAKAAAALHRDLATLDSQRSAVDAGIRPAITSLHPGSGPPRLPG
jgi:hypothetical protein